MSNNRRRPVDRLLDLVPMDAVVRHVDVNELIERVDVQRIVDRVDVNAIVERVDIQRIIDRVDVNALMTRIDVNEIIDRVDINAIIERVDVEDVVARTEIGQVVVASTTGMATRGLDFVRAQGVGLDQWCNRWVDRILRRRPGDAPAGPGITIGAPGPEAAP
ncbi:MAG TPA: hypothetical protein VF152_13840 [Acidimicrobiia bacterium]